MDSTWTTREVAARMGVSIPTVRRTVRCLGLRPALTPGGHMRLIEADVQALVTHLGTVPVIAGLTRVQVQVLAALSRAPLGLRSVRAVARAAAVSPTAAGRALEAMFDAGLVGRDERTLAEGRAVTGTVWRIATGPAWFAIADQVGATVLPVAQRAEPARRLPRRFWHLFWNADPATLDLLRDAEPIAVRMLLGDDLEALAWACAHLPADALWAASGNRGAEPQIRSLVDNALAAR